MRNLKNIDPRPELVVFTSFSDDFKEILDKSGCVLFIFVFPVPSIKLDTEKQINILLKQTKFSRSSLLQLWSWTRSLDIKGEQSECRISGPVQRFRNAEWKSAFH